MRIKSTLLLLVLLTSILLLAACGRRTQSTENDAEATQTAVVESANESEEAEDFVAEESADGEVATEDSEAEITAEEADAEGKDEAQPAKLEISSSEEISETDELIIDQPTEGKAADEAAPEDEEQAEEMIQPSDAVTTTESAVEDSSDETQPTDPEILVSVHDDVELGKILVDADGMTLYVFDEDEAGKSNCTGGCLEKWPPLYVDNEDEVLASNDITGEVGTIEAGDGMFQVTIDDQPLYYYAEDAEPCDVNGQGVNDAWWVVAVDGTAITGE